MDDSEKYMFELLFKLRESHLNSFQNRRLHGWKICISLWSAYAITLISIITNQLPAFGLHQKIIITIFSGILLFCHCYWIIGYAKAQYLDRDIAISIEKKLIKIIKLELTSELDSRIYNIRIPNKKNDLRSITSWAHLLQICISFILLVNIILMIWK